MTNKQNWKVEDVTGALEDCKSFDILLNDRFVATTSSKKMAWRIVNALKKSTSQVNTATDALDELRDRIVAVNTSQINMALVLRMISEIRRRGGGER